MNILVVGAGVIGTVYGAHLGAANHRISVLAHGERTAAIAVRGLLPGTSPPASRRRRLPRS